MDGWTDGWTGGWVDRARRPTNRSRSASQSSRGHKTRMFRFPSKTDIGDFLCELRFRESFQAPPGPPRHHRHHHQHNHHHRCAIMCATTIMCAVIAENMNTTVVLNSEQRHPTHDPHRQRQRRTQRCRPAGLPACLPACPILQARATTTSTTFWTKYARRPRPRSRWWRTPPCFGAPIRVPSRTPSTPAMAQPGRRTSTRIGGAGCDERWCVCETLGSRIDRSIYRSRAGVSLFVVVAAVAARLSLRSRSYCTIVCGVSTIYTHPHGAS